MPLCLQGHLPVCPCECGSGFFLACEDFWGRFDESLLACAFLFACLFKWRSVYARQFHSFGQDQSTVVQRAETTVDERSLSSCVRARRASCKSVICWECGLLTLTPRLEGHTPECTVQRAPCNLVISWGYNEVCCHWFRATAGTPAWLSSAKSAM